MRYVGIKKCLLYFTCFVALICATCSKTLTSEIIVQQLFKDIPQNFTIVMQDATIADAPVVDYDSSKLINNFLCYYFTVWDNPGYFFKVENLKYILQEDIKEVLEQPGYSLNKWPTDQRMITSIFANMDLDAFPKLSKQPAIAPTCIYLRGLPTETSSFSISRTSD